MMILQKSQLAITKAENIKRYLIMKGWVNDPRYSDGNFNVYYKSFSDMLDERFLAYIPLKLGTKDYPIRVYQLIEMLSGVEERGFEDILFEINNPLVDRLYIRISSSFSELGSIPLTYANHFIKSMKNLILFSITNQLNPRPIHNTYHWKANKIADSFRLGQTSYGSYTFLIEAPNSPNEFFNRRVIETIGTTLGRLTEIQFDQKIDLKLLCSDGVSFNMIKSITNLINKVDAVDFEYELCLFSSNNNNTKSKISISYSDIKEVQRVIDQISNQSDFYKYINNSEADNKNIEGNYQISAYIREDIDEKEGITERLTIKGHIIELSSRNRNVAIIESEKGIFTVGLNDQYYKLACDAHRDRKLVRATGIAINRNSQIFFIDADEFDYE